MGFWNILLMIVSCLLVIIIMLQESKEDAQSAFTGEKNKLFSVRKKVGIEVWVAGITTALAISFFVISFIVAYL